MLKILIAEDDKNISDLIDLSLSGTEYSCTCVYDGMAAADAVSETVFVLVLLDV